MPTLTDASAPSIRNTGPGWPRVLALHAGLLALWLLAFFAARLLEYAPHASLWFPPAAVTLAALLVLGLRALPALWLACILATLITEQAYAQQLGAGALLASSLLFAFGHTAAYGLAAALLLRFVRGRTRHETTLRAVSAFLLIGALGAALAAVAGAAGLVLGGMLPARDFGGLLVPWWIGDYAGLVALAPLMLLGLVAASERAGLRIEEALPRFRPQHPSRSGRRRGFRAKLALLLGVSAAILVAHALLPGQEALVFTLFFAVVIQSWIVHSEGQLQSLVAVAAFSLLLAVASAMLELGEDALVLQFALISLAANSYFGLALPTLYADNQRLRQLLTHDALTGALSRAFFEDRAREGIETARQRGHGAALLMIDLDRLKAINDEYGHAAGDAALRALADRCSASLRAGDVFGRLSGDEFGAFLPGAGGAEAAAVVRRMREALAALPVPGTAIPLQASIGCATMHQGSEDYEALMARADALMYREKRGEATPAAPLPPD